MPCAHLEETPGSDEMAVDMIKVGESSGALTEMLDSVVRLPATAGRDRMQRSWP